MKRRYERAYRPEWEQDSQLSSWLSRAKDDEDVAFCKACNCKLITRLSSLKEHVSSQKHKKNIIGYSGQISSLITTKEGIKEHGDCVSFQPTKNMIKNMSSKSMYKENEDCLDANVDQY